LTNLSETPTQRFMKQKIKAETGFAYIIECDKMLMGYAIV
jgi:hypothetical protein